MEQAKSLDYAVYYDRHGKEHVPESGDLQYKRKGVFAVCVSHGSLLLMWPQNESERPELPGGGVERNENNTQALVREIYEETGVFLPSDFELKGKTFEQRVAFYANDKDEYWDYEQIFYFIEGEAIDEHYFEGGRKTPENGLAVWVNIKNLKGRSFHHVHKTAVRAFLGEDVI